MAFPSDYRNDPEVWTQAPDRLRPIIDAHVHLFPDPFFHALVEWFRTYAWEIRYRMSAIQIVDFLLEKGFARIVGLSYSHKPGLAGFLNEHMARLVSSRPQVIGAATVFPGEDNAEIILKDAFDAGLCAVKLHAHVQWVDMESDAMNRIFQVCSDSGKPLVIHAGKEPRSADFPYRWDPYEYCSAHKVERVLKDFPHIRLCVPHMGADEFDEYEYMLGKYDNLWLDTTMMLADFFPIDYSAPLEKLRPDRIMYGSDFPNIPYGWDLELRALDRRGLSRERLKPILYDNALNFFNINDDMA